MARRRDYKAEYQRAKARARELGYSGQREYKQARKELGLTGTRAMPVPRRILEGMRESESWSRGQAREWSRKHSHNKGSQYKESMTDDEVRQYLMLYRYKPRSLSKQQFLSNLKDLLVPDTYTAEEFDDRYGNQ